MSLFYTLYRNWKLGPKDDDGMPTYPVECLSTEQVSGTNVYRWKLHTNWITEIQYFPSLRCFASCSSDPIASLVLGTYSSTIVSVYSCTIGSPTGSTPVDQLLSNSQSMTIRQHSLIDKGRPKSTLPAKTRVSLNH